MLRVTCDGPKITSNNSLVFFIDCLSEVDFGEATAFQADAYQKK